ncbi:hypothetical protein L2W58_08475 [Dethiosulfovibrio sp. F2B]|uniref:GAF domain-containing protein n=1 Tax=Dethiosulfovibrio faecalis TaxID=2720018 RepID=UPI001F33EDA0|nr:hypothetical protein [Dethiosulfovibrio faecalis]MCF4151836.1 hypothetical protein [Dethiosulfovibrio faecalis]
MTLCSLYEQAAFLLGGGVLELLVKFLGERVGRLAILQPDGDDLSLVDGVGIASSGAILYGGMDHVRRLLAKKSDQGVTILEIDGIMDLALEEDWSRMVLLGGSPWVVAVMLPEVPDEETLRLLKGADGLVRIWDRHRSIDGIEKNMASLSYLLYAVKSALPSIFEPFPPEFLATFLVDVMKESICPERISLLQDDGKSLCHLAGDESPLLDRGGIFSKEYLSPVPVPIEESHRFAVGSDNFDRLGELYSVVLPIISGSDRFFYLVKWGSLRSGEVSDVLELIGGVTVKAMAMNRLREEGTSRVKELSRREFALRGLHRAIISLMENDTEDELLSRVLDIFGEMTQSSRCFVVVYDKSVPGYVKWGDRADGVVKVARHLLVSREEPLELEPLPGVLSVDEAVEILRDHGLSFDDELCSDERSMDLVFPLRYGSTFVGFIAVSSSVTGSRYGDMDGLETLAASCAVAIRRCRLFGEVSMQRDLLDRQIRARDFLRDLAGEIQQIRSVDVLKNSLSSTLPLALDVEKADMICGVEGLAEISEKICPDESVIFSDVAVWVPLRSGGTLHGALKLTVEDPRSVGDDRLELMSLVGAFVAPRLEAMKCCHRGKVMDVGRMVELAVRSSVEELILDGFEPSVISATVSLSEEQERCCFRVLKEGTRAIVVLPFPWEGEIRQLFPPSDGWAPFVP